MYVVIVDEVGEPAKACGPFRSAGRAEGTCASIEGALDRAGVDATAFVVPCLPVEAWTVGLSPAASPGVDS